MAALLSISTKNIDNHSQHMLHKTESKSSAELVNYGIRWGMV